MALLWLLPLLLPLVLLHHKHREPPPPPILGGSQVAEEAASVGLVVDVILVWMGVGMEMGRVWAVVVRVEEGLVVCRCLSARMMAALVSC